MLLNLRALVPMLVVLVSLHLPSWACTCSRELDPCQHIMATQEDELATAVAFVGVILGNSDNEADDEGPVKVRIEEHFFGLPPHLKIVDVYARMGASCDVHLEKGGRYMLFGHSVKGKSLAVLTSSCSGSFPVEGEEKLLAAMRDAYRDGLPTIVGYVETRAARSLRVTATGPLGTLSKMTDADGTFVFTGITPGDWTVSVSDERYVAGSSLPEGGLLSVGNGCVIVSLWAWPDGQVHGHIFDSVGKPRIGVPVQAFIENERDSNDFGDLPLRQSVTDENGHYQLSGLPRSRLLVAVNGKTGVDEEVWAPTFYRNATSRETAVPIALGKFERRMGVDLHLPPARKAVEFQIEAYFEDGRRVPRLYAKLRDKKGNVRATASLVTQDGESPDLLRLLGFSGEEYLLECTASEVSAGGDLRSYEGTAILGAPLGTSIAVRVLLRRKGT